MRTRAFAVAAFAVLGGLASSDVGLAQAPTSAPRAPHRMRPEHDMRSYGVVETLPGMEKVRVVESVTYKTVDGVALQMDLTYPADAPPGSRARPAVVFV